MDAVKAYLPAQEGLLPLWLLLISVAAIGNSVQSYSTMYFTQRIYNGQPAKSWTKATATKKSEPDISKSPVTPLTTRMFGTWTLVQSMVRLYGAYNIDNPVIYQMVFLTNLVAAFHFTSEWLVFGTAGWGLPLASPMTVSVSSLIWMALQKDFYVK